MLRKLRMTVLLDLAGGSLLGSKCQSNHVGGFDSLVMLVGWMLWKERNS